MTPKTPNPEQATLAYAPIFYDILHRGSSGFIGITINNNHAFSLPVGNITPIGQSYETS